MIFLQQLYSHSPIFFQKEWILALMFLVILYFVQSKQYLEMYLYALLLFFCFFLLFLLLSAEFLSLIFFISYISLISVLVIGYISFVENWLQGFLPEKRLFYSSKIKRIKGLFLSTGFIVCSIYFISLKEISGLGFFYPQLYYWEINWFQHLSFFYGEYWVSPYSSFLLFSFYFYATSKYLFILLGLILYISSLGSLALLKTQALFEEKK